MMTSDLRELYQEMILDHGKNPRNFRTLEHPTHQAAGNNPLCGDRVTVYLKVEDGVIRDISFQGKGCAISTASASLMTQSVKGKSVDEARKLFDAFHAMATGKSPDPAPEALGKLSVFGGVSAFPARVKCATLAWQSLKAALASDGSETPSVSTE